MSKTWPVYEALNGIHTMTWEDGSKLVYDHPHVEKKDYIAFVHAYGPAGTLVGEEPVRIFNSTDMARLVLRCAALNGATPVNWNARAVKMGEAVRTKLLEQ